MSEIKRLLELSLEYAHKELSYKDLMIECNNDIEKAQLVIDMAQNMLQNYSSIFRSEEHIPIRNGINTLYEK